MTGVALVTGLLLASGPPCEPRVRGVTPPPAEVFAVLGAPLLDGSAFPEGRVPMLPPTSPPEPLPIHAKDRAVPEGCLRNGCWAWAGWNDRRAMRGAGARLSIEAPEVSGRDHSLADVSLQWGPDGQEIVEVGWEVSPGRYHDNAPHLFVQRWVRGRPCEAGCSFFRWSGRLAPGMSLAPWIGKDLAVGWLLREGRAWAWADGEWLGAFELGEDAPVTANVAQWFGEVFSLEPTWQVPMGTGQHPDLADAATIGSVCDVPESGAGCVVRATRFARVTRPDIYLMVRNGPGGFAYGGPVGPAGVTPRPPPSSASEGTPPATGRSATSPPG